MSRSLFYRKRNRSQIAWKSNAQNFLGRKAQLQSRTWFEFQRTEHVDFVSLSYEAVEGTFMALVYQIKGRILARVTKALPTSSLYDIEVVMSI